MKTFSLVLALAVVVCGCGDPGTSDQRSGTGGSGGMAGSGGMGGMPDLCADAATRCDDSNDCTQNLCEPTDGVCSNRAEPDDTVCEFAEGVGGVCTAGACVDAMLCADAATRCEDMNECTDDDCDTADGSCSNVAVADDTVCEFAEGVGGVCTAGVCADAMLCADAATRCDDINQCTDDDCDTADGSCSSVAEPDDTVCEFAEGVGGVCTAGVCVDAMLCADAATRCYDTNECTQNLCDSADGTCSNPAEPDDTVCEFAEGVGGVCTAGACVDAMLCAGVDCDDAKECTQDVCDPMDGQCNYANVTDGTSCDFGGLPGICGAGTCEDAMLCAGVHCDDANECTQDVCDPMDGQCDYNPVPSWSQCSFAGLPGVCVAGSCEKGLEWGEPYQFANSGEAPDVALDPDGNALAVWSGVWANRFTPNGGWETDLSIGTGLDARVVVNSSGDAVAAWYQNGGSGFSIWASLFHPLQGWDNPQVVVVDSTGDTDGPEVGMDRNGKAMLVWRQGSDDRREKIWASLFAPGEGWAVPTRIDAGVGPASAPQIAMNPNGNAIVVWSQYDGVGIATESAWANQFTPVAGWGTPEMIESEPFFEARRPRVGMDMNGNAIAVWYLSTSSNPQIWANRFSSTEGWGTEQMVNNGSGRAYDVEVAMGANGDAIAVWPQQDDVWANRYVPGAGWGTAELIEAGSDDASWAASHVAINANGHAVAVWRQYDAYDYAKLNLFANRYVPGAGWGTAELIESDNTLDVYAPRVALDPSGNAIVVWSQGGIWARRLE